MLNWIVWNRTVFEIDTVLMLNILYSREWDDKREGESIGWWERAKEKKVEVWEIVGGFEAAIQNFSWNSPWVEEKERCTRDERNLRVRGCERERERKSNDEREIGVTRKREESMGWQERAWVNRVEGWERWGGGMCRRVNYKVLSSSVHWFTFYTLLENIYIYIYIYFLLKKTIGHIKKLFFRFFLFWRENYLLCGFYLHWALDRDYLNLIFYFWIFYCSCLELFPTLD